MTALSIINVFATFLVNFGRLALFAALVLWIMFKIGAALQSAARRRMIVATKRGYELAGKPVEPPAERRNRVNGVTKRAA